MNAKNSYVLSSWLFIVMLLGVPYTQSADYFKEPVPVSNSDGNDNNNGDYLVSLNLHNKLQGYGQSYNQYEQIRQQQKYAEKSQYLIHSSSPSTALTSSDISPPMASTESSSDAISAISTTPSLHSAFIYKAVIPMHTGLEANKIFNAVKLFGVPYQAVTAKSSLNINETNNSSINPEKDDDLSQKLIGSSVVTSVSVILNGNEPEFTDALGQKVPKPQPSLQVASPINLLNPDRYEFYTFDDYGELIKRLMTMEEIRSIVANGDGEGPPIIHHSPIEYQDPEKNVQDIVDSVQSVLNKEVEYNKNTSTENVMAFDTPDVSSSWSMILPAIFGNTGNVDIFSHQKPQQIVMTPDTEIMEISTKVAVTTTKKPKPVKRKPGQKRKYPATTTEVTPQVIQEELDSQESVYTGMQQYYNLASTMHNYDGISMHMQPLYHKLPETETTSHSELMNTQQSIKKLVPENNETVMTENVSKKSVYVEQKPLALHRVKKPNLTQSTRRRPQINKKKITIKPTVAATTRISPKTSMTALRTTFEASTTITFEPTRTTKTTPSLSPTTITYNATSMPPSTEPTSQKKRTTSIPLLFHITALNGIKHKLHLEDENRKTSSKPHKQKPKPMQEQLKYPHLISAHDTVVQETSNLDFQQVSLHKTAPQQTEAKYETPLFSPPTAPTVPSNTVVFSASPTPTDIQYAFVIVKDSPEFESKTHVYEEFTTQKAEEPTALDIPSTSGYPVPSDDFLNYKNQPLLSFAATQHGNTPFEQDLHTLPLFDQIMQTLKQSTQTSEKLTGNTANVSQKLSLETDSSGNMTLDSVQHNFKDGIVLSNSDLLTTDNTSIKNESQNPDVKIEGITTNTSIEEYTTYNTVPSFHDHSQELRTSTDIPESEVVPITEYVSFPHQYQMHTKDFEESFDSSASIITERLTPTNIYKSTIKEQKRENYTDQLTTENQFLVFLSKTKDENYPHHPIFLANLKSQLNMEVVKPSDQITMPDFQTQAATVASTLIDGTPADYRNVITDEDDVVLSAANHQIPNNKQENQYNYNRYSNHNQIDLSLFNSFTKVGNQFINSTNSNTVITSIENNKPIYERLENTSIRPPGIENIYNESTHFVSITEIPGGSFTGTHSQEFTTLEGATTEPHTTTEDIKEYQTVSDNEIKNISTEELDKIIANDDDFRKTTLMYSDNDTTSPIVIASYEDVTTTNEPILSFADSYEHPEADTIFINDMFDENTPLASEDSSNSDTELEYFFEAITFAKSKNNNVSDIGSQFENTAFDHHVNKGDLETVTQINWKKFESSKAKGNTSGMQTTETLEFDYTNSQIKKVSTKPESYGITTDRIIHNSNQNEDQSKENKGDYTTVEIVASKESIGINQQSEEASSEQTKLISEEEKSPEYIEEDPYVKLGETTTLKTELNLEMNTIAINYLSEKPKYKNYSSQLAPQKLIETNASIQIQSNAPVRSYDHLYEEPDEEDEDDQLADSLPNSPNFDSNSSFPTETGNTITTYKPEVFTTHRLNTLKPVSYFNKQSTFALYEEPVEPLHIKSRPYSSNQKETTISKVPIYSAPNLQQRVTQRPPQLNNLIISATQTTRRPVKLEPSPPNYKGLELSLANLDKDILSFAQLCNELAFSFWKSITSEKVSSARSLVMSPFALTSMLSMIFLGARGSTSGEMNDVLKLDDMVTFNPHLVFKNITDSVEKSMDNDIATTAFVREIYSDRSNGKVLQFFKEKSQQLYAGHVEEVNFHVVNDIIRRRTNLLVKRHTMGKVLEYLRTNSVWVNGPLATISANLFQTDCSKGSIQDRDGEILFQVHPTVRQRRLIPIPAVLFRSGFTAGYEPNLNATVIAFGHIQDTTSVIYVMPDHLSSISPSDNLDRLEKQLIETAISKKAWSCLLTAPMEQPGVEVQIPRFSHRSFVNATAGLRKLGLEGLFKSDQADLGGFTGSPNRDIYLSDMIQINTFSTCGEAKIADHHHIEMYPAPPLRKRNKDFGYEQDSSDAPIVDIDTIVQAPIMGRGFYDDLLDPKYLELPLPLRPRQARVPEAPRLRLDKPFLYFVRHNPSGVILFMGRFNPRLMP